MSTDVNAGFGESTPGAAGLHRQWYEANVAVQALTAQRCECGYWRMPARYRCPVCHSDVWTFAPVSARGTVVSWTVTHRPFHFGFAQAVPYAILIVEVAEGVRFFVHARPALADLVSDSDPDGVELRSALIGTDVRLDVDSFGVPFAVLPDGA